MLRAQCWIPRPGITEADYASDQRYLDIATGNPTKSMNGHMMSTIAKRLSEDDKRALASYIQGLR